MRKFVTKVFPALALMALVSQVIIPAQPVFAQTSAWGSPQSAKCQEGVQTSGARYRICLPPGEWNGDLVVYAHGYVQPDSPLALPGEASSISAPLRQMGYAFATTSYRVNGLAVLPAIDDLLDLVSLFNRTHGPARRVLIMGASEGGLITTLAVERHPEVFAGGLEMCGPNNFQDQVSYFGDFRVVFDALFPGLLPSDPVRIPASLISRWPSLYREQVLPVLLSSANRAKLVELMTITGAAYDPDQPATIENTVRGVLGYNIYATNDAAEKLGGQPFDNAQRRYSGSTDDQRLNEAVQRIQADSSALRALQKYQASGELRVPLVGLHNTGDEIVPFFHLNRYAELAAAKGNGARFHSIPVERYGHCNFTNAEILDAFSRLVQMVDAPQPAQPVTLAAVSPTTAPTINTPESTQAPPPTQTPTVALAPEPTTSPAAPSRGAASLWDRFVEMLKGLVQLGKG